jgi:hypothetical protein
MQISFNTANPSLQNETTTRITFFTNAITQRFLLTVAEDR